MLWMTGVYSVSTDYLPATSRRSSFSVVLGRVGGDYFILVLCKVKYSSV